MDKHDYPSSPTTSSSILDYASRQKRPHVTLFIAIGTLGFCVGCLGLFIFGRAITVATHEVSQSHADVAKANQILARAIAAEAAEAAAEEAEAKRPPPRGLTAIEAEAVIAQIKQIVQLTPNYDQAIRGALTASGQRLIDPKLPVETFSTPTNNYGVQHISARLMKDCLLLTTYHRLDRNQHPTRCDLTIEALGQISFIKVDSPVGRITTISQGGSSHTSRELSYRPPQAADPLQLEQVSVAAHSADSGLVVTVSSLMASILLLISAMIVLRHASNRQISVPHCADVSARWYVLGVVAVGICHFLGSLIFLGRYYDNWYWGMMGPDGRPPLLTLFVNSYEFPMIFARDHGDIMTIGGISFRGDNWQFLTLAVVNAVIWGASAVCVGHAVLSAFRRSQSSVPREGNLGRT